MGVDNNYSQIEVGKAVAFSVESQQLPKELLVQLAKNQVVCSREGQFWDFKRSLPLDEALPLAELCKDIAAFFNAFGGFIIFGVDEVEKDLRFSVIGVPSAPFDMQRLKGVMGKYLSVMPDISYDEYEIEVAGQSRTIAALAIPKRSKTVSPAKFLIRGPEKKSRPVFNPDQLAVRRGDQSRLVTTLEDWQLVSGDRELDSVGLEIGQQAGRNGRASVLSHNLPTRSAICKKFVGRKDVLALLWEWLNDDFQYCRVIAGDGGKGKTSLAYEFATQVARISPCGFTRIVWLTAKKRQFHPESNAWQEMHETHFTSFGGLLSVLAEHLGYIPEDMVGATESQINRMVRQQLNIQPTLFVFDDLDSLTPDDQKRTLEFASQVGRSDIRFLLTTRSNASYSTDLCLKLRGLDIPDFNQLVELLVERYSVRIPDGVKTLLHSSTGGSPLLVDSIFRLIRRGVEPAKAVKEWAGAAGEDARKAVLQKEIDQLSTEAKRVLLAIAYLNQCSRTEAQQVTNLPDLKLADCLLELESLFLVEAPKIIQSEPRYEMSPTSIILVRSQQDKLALDHVSLEKKVNQIRSRMIGKVSRDSRDKIGRAVSQALALARATKYDEAIQTVNAVLRTESNHPDLLLLRARLELHAPSDYLEDARRDLRAAHRYGCRKPLLFDLWLQAEQRAESGRGIIDVCNLASDIFPEDRPAWSERKAEGFVREGLVRARSGNYESAVEELGAAAAEVHYAFESGEATDSAAENIHLIHEKQLSYLEKIHNTSGRIDACIDMVKRGDIREKVLVSSLEAIRLHSNNVNNKGQGARDWISKQCNFFISEIRRGTRAGADATLNRYVEQFQKYIKS